MTTILQTPIDLAEAKKVGKLTYRKQVLPLGTINYKGRKITFDKKYLTDLANSFKKGAYDQVPFQFADGENRHNMDPEQYRGEITSLELAADGLDMVVSVTPAGAKAIKSNPRLGVSARIVEGLAKSDGRTFPRAIQHVLATMDPRITGMRPWKTVDLSGDDEGSQIVDLSTETYEETKVGKTTTKSKIVQRDGVLDLSSLSDEEFEALLDLADAKVDDEADETDEDEDEDEDEDDEESDEDDESDDDEDEEEDEEDDDLDSDEPEVEEEKPAAKAKAKTADLSVPTKKAKSKAPAKGKRKVDLSAQALANTDRETLKQMRIDLAAERFTSERDKYIDAGVPAFMVDLAQPLLSLPDAAVIDLSEDETLDATAVVRKMLDGLKGIVDLGVEIGHSIDLSDDEDGDGKKKDPEAAMLDEWSRVYGKA